MAPRLTQAIVVAVILTAVGSVIASSEEPATAGAKRRFRFTADVGASLLVHGEYPMVTSSCVNTVQPVLHARFRGAVEAARAGDGTVYLIGELGFEDYLKGIAEVPRSWPMEALKAQVVAARTYAMNRLEEGSSEGRALGYDLCATVACQVYIGMGVEAGAWGPRWVRAVDETAGQVLLHGGGPAVTFYSSTSNGRTYPNEEVFGGEPLPYLRGAVESDDGESPLAHWEVRVPFDDLARFLEAGGVWTGGAINKVTRKGEHVVIRGGDTQARLHREDLRDELNGIASCLDPDYPSTEADGYRLPQTVPSDWYEARQDGSALVLEGRGWGHGVGMVQWGAKGKADRGLSYSDILAAYYGGLRPEPIDVPGSIRVLIAEGLESVTLEPSGPAEVSGAQRLPSAPWLVTGGRRLRLSKGTAPTPALEIEAGQAKRTADRVRTSIEISKNANIRFEFFQGNALVASTPWRPREKGRTNLREPLPAISAGIYGIRVGASDGVDAIAIPAGRISVSARAASAATPSPTASPRTPGESAATAPAERTEGPSMGLMIGILLALLAAVLALFAGRRRGAHRR